MLRIKTKMGGGYVHTLFSFGKWVSILHLPGHKTKSTEAVDLLGAGENHLALSLDLWKMIGDHNGT